MTLIRKMTSHEVRRRLALVAMVVGVLVCLSVQVSADRRCGTGMKPYMRGTGLGPCVLESPVLVSDTIADTSLTVEGAAAGVVDDLATGETYHVGSDVDVVPARRKLGSSGETAGGVITSIVFLLIVAASIWCCCTGRCCGPQVIVQQSTAQATAQTQANNQTQNLVVNIPEQKLAPAPAPTTYFVNMGGTTSVFDAQAAVATAQAGTVQSTAQTVVGIPGSVEMAHLHNGVGSTGPGPYSQQQAHYPPPPPPQQQAPSPLSNYPPQQQEPSPLSNYPPPKMA